MARQDGTRRRQSATADREIVISRVSVPPRELVFEAFTEVGTCRDGGDRRGSPPPRGRRVPCRGEWDFV